MELEKILSADAVDNFNEKSLNKIIITLKIITKNPILKKLESLRNLIEQIIKGISFLQNNYDQFKNKSEVYENAKEMLNYIKKENILLNTDLIVEKVNELGIKLFKLENTLNRKEKETCF